MNRRIAWIVIGIVIAASLVVAGTSSGRPPSDAERAQQLADLYACPTCDGQSVAESNAAVAATIRDFIRLRVAAGASDDEIRDELVRSYGSEVLLTPPSDGISVLVWILPTAVVILALFGVAATVRRRQQAGPVSAADRDLVAAARRATTPSETD